MAIAGLHLPGDWGWLPLAFSAGLIWRPPPAPPVQVLCPEAAGTGVPASRGFGALTLLAAFLAGIVAGRLWGSFAPAAQRFRRAVRIQARPLFH